MKLTVDSTVTEVRTVLRDNLVPEEQNESICKILRENCMDCETIATTEFDTLKKAFSSIPLGYLIKVVNHCAKIASLSATEPDSDSDTLPVSESELSTATSSTTSNDSTAEICDDLMVPNLTRPVPKEFPSYRFQFNFHGREVIRTGDMTEAGKRDITAAIINASKHYERFPSPSLRKLAVAAFVKLGKASLGLGEEEAKRFWLRKITQKLNSQAKQERRLSSKAPCSKRSYNNKSGVANTAVIKRRKAQCIDCTDSIEDMNISKEIMREEFMKAVGQRNKKIIADKMKETFMFRRKFIVDTNPVTKEVFKDWPALKVYDEIVSEFQRLQPIACADKQQIKNIGMKMMRSVLTFIRGKPHKNISVQKILETLPLEENELEQNDDLLFITGLQLLCCSLKENTKRKYNQYCYIVDSFPINTTVSEIADGIPDRLQPFLAIYGTPENQQKHTVFIDKCPVLNVNSIFEGIIVVMAFHYIFNYEYCQHIKKVMQFLQVYLFKLPLQKPYTLCSSVLELALSLKLNQ